MSESVRIRLLICLFLSIASITVYWQVRNHTYIDFDDDLIVLNPYVQSGLTPMSIAWAFSTSVEDGQFWKPLTWLSHMLDYQLFGPNYGIHHLMSLFFHVINVVLLFLTLQQMSGTIWRGAFVAALFALHPMNVESVAWLTQRHNVLSTFWGLLTLYSYGFYVKKPNISRYAVTLFLFMFSLMSKPMLITLPFVLFLLDYWPFERIREIKSKAARDTIVKLVLEKMPFLGISLMSVLLSFQRIGTSFVSMESLPVSLRLKNALVSYVTYIGKMVWPFDLAIYYPYHDMISAWQWIFSGVLLLGVTVFCFRMIVRKPYLIVGWLWYLGTLVPVIGIIQAGLQPQIADRNAYVTFIGLFIIIAWGMSDILSTRRDLIAALRVSTSVLLLLLFQITWIQVGYWVDSITIFTHAIDVTDNNFMAQNNLGFALAAKGKTLEAIDHYEKALRIFPDFELAHLNIGVAMAALGKDEDAIEHYLAAIKIRPGLALAHNNLGNIRLRQGDPAAAIKHYSDALSFNPNDADALNGMGGAMTRLGRLDAAIIYFKKAIQLRPGFKQAEKNLQSVLAYKRSTIEK